EVLAAPRRRGEGPRDGMQERATGRTVPDGCLRIEAPSTRACKGRDARSRLHGACVAGASPDRMAIAIAAKPFTPRRSGSFPAPFDQKCDTPQHCTTLSWFASRVVRKKVAADRVSDLKIVVHSGDGSPDGRRKSPRSRGRTRSDRAPTFIGRRCDGGTQAPSAGSPDA